jgi:hypothetical protein
MTLAEAAETWFLELWALASDATFCDMPGAREAWLAKRRNNPAEPLGRLLAARDLPNDILRYLDWQRMELGVEPPGVARERWAALVRADEDLHQRWHQAVRRAEAARVELPRRFCDRMARGEAVARGIVEGRPLDGAVQIPPESWRAALPVFGYEAETIAGFGDHPPGCVVMAGARVLGVVVVPAAEPAAAAAEPEPPPPRGARADLAEAARTWMRENVKPGRTKRGDAVTDCMRATGCTRACARAAWAALPADSRPPPGRPLGG